MRTERTLLIILALLLSISTASARVTVLSEANEIRVDLLRYDPSPVEPGKTLFMAEVPTTTGLDSFIFIQWYSPSRGEWSSPEEMIEMTKTATYTWEAQVALSPASYGSDGEYFYYRYVRNRMGYEGAELFPIDSPNAYRKLPLEGSADKIRGDIVAAWR